MDKFTCLICEKEFIIDNTNYFEDDSNDVCDDCIKLIANDLDESEEQHGQD